MEEVVRIAPVAHEPGLIAYECPSCHYVTSMLWQPKEPDAKERPKRITWPALGKLTESAASRALSKDLRQRGFSFVGPTTMYAMMQAMGLVNDHLEGCPVRERALAARTRFRLPR